MAKVKKLFNSIIAIIIFLILIGSAFAVSILFGLVYIFGFAYEVYTGRITRRPLVAIALFIGGLIIRIAMQYLLQPVFVAQTTIDLVMATVLFIGLFFLGYKIKKGKK